SSSSATPGGLNGSTATQVPGNSTAGDATTGGTIGGGFGGGATTGGGATAGGGATTGGGATLDTVTTGGAVSKQPGTSASKPAKAPVSTGKAIRVPPSPSTSIVRLRDVAKVEMGALNYNTSCLFDGKPSVGISVYQLPGTNALEMTARVRDKMEELKRRFPEAMDWTIAYDITPSIR